MRLLRWSGTSPNTGTTYENEGAVQLEDDRGQQVSAEAAGAAAELELWLWGRRPDGAVSVTGDNAVARRLWDLAREATQ